MTMEIWRGKAQGVSKPEEGGLMECTVGTCRVKVHADVERAVAEGQEILVAGPKEDDKLIALAVHNLDTKQQREVDASNYVLFLGLGGFLCLLGFILAFQFKAEGNMTLASANTLMCFGGFGLMGWAFAHVRKIKRCASWVQFAD